MAPKAPTIDIKTSGPGATAMRHKMEKHAISELDAYGKPKGNPSKKDMWEGRKADRALDAVEKKRGIAEGSPKDEKIDSTIRRVLGTRGK